MIEKLMSGAGALAMAIGLAIAPAGDAAAVEIDYWQYFFKERVEAIDALIEKFEAANPDIKVNHTHFPYAQYRTKVAAAVPAGQGPDVVQLYYGWLRDYRDAKLLVPLPEDQFPAAEIESAFFPIVQAMKMDGQYWGLPTAVRSLALFYNKALFTKAGLDPNTPPATYEELIADAGKIVERDAAGNLLTAGMTASPTSQDHHWWREVLVRQSGGQPYSDDNRTVAYNDEAGLKAAETYAALFGAQKLTDYGFMQESQAAFKAGKAGMHIDGSFRLGTFADISAFEWGVAELPSDHGVRSNFASYWVNGVTTKADDEKRAAAFKFLKFVTSAEAMQLWVDTVGELPARKAAALTEANIAHPLYGPFIRGLEYAHTTDFVNESAQRQVFLDMIDRVALAGSSVKDALATAAQEEQKILDDYYGKK